MHRVIKNIYKSQFLKHTAIFSIGSMSVGLLNYLDYPVLGRLMHASSFGEVQTLASLFAQIAIFLSVLGLITVNITANYEDEARRNSVLIELERLAVLAASILLVISLVAANALKHFFSFGSWAPFPLLALAILATVPTTFRVAFLRGIKRFGKVSISGVIGSAFDLILAAAFVIAGLGTSGAILGLIVGQLIALIYTSWQSRKHGFAERNTLYSLNWTSNMLVNHELKYSLLVIIGAPRIPLVCSLDVVVVTH